MSTTMKALERELAFIRQCLEKYGDKVTPHAKAFYWALREKEMELLERIGKELDSIPP